MDYAFVQYFNVFESNEMSIDAVNKTIERINLKRARSESDGKSIPVKHFGVCTLHLLGCTAHVVEVSYVQHRLNGEFRRNKEIEALYGNDRVQARQWDSDLFYVNRFFSND